MPVPPPLMSMATPLYIMLKVQPSTKNCVGNSVAIPPPVNPLLASTTPLHGWR